MSARKGIALAADPHTTADSLIEELSRALSASAPAEKKIAIAVSGGPDSMAALALAHRGAPGRVAAFTVDHGLRPESAGEAAMVAAWCARHDIPHETLTLPIPLPETGTQAAARQARYYLLAQACNRDEIDLVVTGHHADDNRETVFATLARGSGVDGLSGMKEKTRIAADAGPPVTLWRPFLKWARADLELVATRLDLPVAHDPSNDDPIYERVRRRGFLAALSVQQYLPPASLSRTIDALSMAQQRLAGQIAEDFRACGGLWLGTGAAQLNHRDWLSRSMERRGALAARLGEVVGANVPGGIDPSAAALAVNPDETTNSATLGGAMFIQHGKHLTICREPAARTGRHGVPPLCLPVVAGEKKLFDDRFIVQVPEDAPAGATLEPYGLAQKGPRHATHPRATMPVLKKDGAIIAAPAYLKSMLSATVAPWIKSAGDLHIGSLCDERFGRHVVRFEYPRAAGT